MKKNIKINTYSPMTGALDFSHLLDAPAGKHGFVSARDGNLCFENGKRIRFFGFNFPGGGMMPEKETAEKYAERLASMGVNVVRLHAGDGLRMGRNSLIDYSKGNSIELDLENLDRCHYFINQLKIRGIYVQVDLFCYRAFQDGDGLDYQDAPKNPVKSITFYNRRLIELQKDFARKYLKAVNPYTSLDLTDDPCVMCIQINNENSLFYGNAIDQTAPQSRIPYIKELKALFNKWLLSEYGNREGLVKAWTRNNETALLDNEDPGNGTVEILPLGDYCQNWIDHRAYWVGLESPARYADFTRFGVELMRGFYGEIKEYLIELGVKVPINGNNLTSGPADIFACSDVDLIEDNAYYNHPLGHREASRFHLRENVKMDPRKATYPDYIVRDNHPLLQLAGSCISGKPFAVSEWNEYGALPFHSTTFLMQSAYACLQDWDGLMLYSYTGSSNCYEPREDSIAHVYQAFNDPSFVCQIGTLSSIFLQGLLKPARNLIEVCYTKEDMYLLPENYRMPFAFMPFVSMVRAKFLEDDNVYRGNADIAVSSGYTSDGDFKGAKHSLIYARSPYRDALQHDFAGDEFLDKHRSANASEFLGLATLDEKAVVINNTDPIERNRDYTGFSRILDGAMKSWNLLNKNEGLKDIDTFVSDTGEIEFAFSRGQFNIRSPQISSFSGYPDGKTIDMGYGYKAAIKNEKMSLSLLPLDNKTLDKTEKLLLTAIGDTGNDANKWAGDVLLEYAGQLFIDRLEGELEIHGVKEASCKSLDVYGKTVEEIKAEYFPDKNMVSFKFGNEDGAASYEIKIVRS